MDRNLKIFTFIILSFLAARTFGQLPPLQDEQDCIHALTVCQNIYVQPYAYQGAGRIRDEINPYQSCLLTGEQNDVWYTFSVQQAGDLCFSIIPNDPADDYDWALFDLTQASCSEIYSQSQLEVSCNYYTAAPACGGITGANGLTNSSCSDLNEACIPVQVGQTFYLNVSNFSASAQGYTLDFSSSTADIYDQTPPMIEQFAHLCEKEWEIEFDEELYVPSVDAHDLLLISEQGDSLELRSIQPKDSGNSYSKFFRFEIDGLPLSGNFEMLVVDTLLDKCRQMTPLFSKKMQQVEVKRLELRPTEDIFCLGDSISIKAISQGQITWENGLQASTFSFVLDSNRWVQSEAIFSNTCKLRDSLWVAAPRAIFPAFDPKPVYCEKEELLLPAVSGDSVFEFFWKSNDNSWTAQSEHLFSLADTGIQNLSLLASSDLCPEQSRTYTLNVKPMPQISWRGEQNYCIKNGQAKIELKANSSSDETYFWQLEGRAETDSGKVFSQFISQSGKHQLQISAENTWGCVNEERIELQVSPSPALPSLDQESCAGEQVNISIESWGISATNDNFAWMWEGKELKGEYLKSEEKSAGTYSFGVWASNTYGCTDSVWQNLQIHPQPKAGLVRTEFCEGENTLLSLDKSGVEAHWYMDSTYLGFESSFKLAHAKAGNHILSLSLIDSMNCSSTFEAELNIHARPEFELMLEDSLCAGSDLQVMAISKQSELSYDWTSEQALTIQGEGHWIGENLQEDFSISIQATNEKGCKSEKIERSISVLSPSDVRVSLSDSSLFLPYAGLKAVAVTDWPGLSHRWSWGNRSSSEGAKAATQYTEAGTYELSHTVVSPLGCEIEAWSGKVEVKNGGIPRPANAFTPNGDGLNDMWEMYAPPGSQMEVQVFNRWGKKVFEGSGALINWNGRSTNGNIQPAGVYSYVASLSMPGGRDLTFSGTVNLLK